MAIHYHVIDSVKGGCGKTTFAIMLAAFLERMEQKEQACILDMDFLGTSMVSLFFAKKGFESLPDHPIYLNEKVRDFHTGDKKYICTFEAGGSEFHIGFASPNQRDKNAFGCTSPMNYVPGISYSMFRNVLKSLLEKNAEKLSAQIPGSQTEEKTLKHVIFDMPPNYDGFSESVKDCLFDPKHCQTLDEPLKRGGDNGEIHKCHEFFMLNLDNSHVNATIEYVTQYLKTDRKWPDKIFFVFNNNILLDKNNELGPVYASRKEQLADALKSFISDKEKLNRIHFLKTAVYEDYAVYILGGNALKSNRELFQNISPVLEYATIEEEFQCKDDQFFFELFSDKKRNAHEV